MDAIAALNAKRNEDLLRKTTPAQVPVIVTQAPVKLPDAKPDPHNDKIEVAPLPALTTPGFTPWNQPLKDALPTGTFTKPSGVIQVEPLPPLARPLIVTPPPGRDPAADRDAEVARLKAAGFKVVPGPRDTGVVRLRGHIPGYPLPVNIFVPQTYHQDPTKATINLHLHGFLIAGTAESSVFAQANFPKMLADSKATSALVVPESDGKDETFQQQWISAGGYKRFNTFMNNLQSTMGYTGLGKEILTTHSGSGWIGDRLVLNTDFGEHVQYRGHFDDGYGASQYAGRVKADQAILDRGGKVFAIANAGSPAAAQMDGVYYHRKTGRQPDFVYVRNEAGKVVSTYVKKGERAPTSKISEVEAGTPGQLTEVNVTWDRKVGSQHFGVLALMPKVWQMGDPQ